MSNHSASPWTVRASGSAFIVADAYDQPVGEVIIDRRDARLLAAAIAKARGER